jgi:DNA-directed RNA polymerase subunit RPC12/RpoP
MIVGITRLIFSKRYICKQCGKEITEAEAVLLNEIPYCIKHRNILRQWAYALREINKQKKEIAKMRKEWPVKLFFEKRKHVKRT